MTVSDLPAVNATLNALSACFVLSGYLFIRANRVRAHRNCMIAAVGLSGLFLVSYLTYHFSVTAVTRFQGQGWIRPVYFGILLSHTLLAMVVVPMVLATLWRAAKGRFEQHRRLARWTLPVWFYVSVTGVVIYLLLYQLYATH